MDSLLPTGFILVVLPLAWLLLQVMCWWLLFRMSPERFRSSQSSSAEFCRPAELAVTDSAIRRSGASS